MFLKSQPDIDPNENSPEGLVVHRFQNRSDAFWSGMRDAAGAPAIVLFAGMVGFGAMGRTSGFDVWFTSFTSIFMFALPGQVVLFEMAITGSSALAIALAVTLTATRFITMTVTLFPQFHEKDRSRGLYASVHLLAMTAWAISMREFRGKTPFELFYWSWLSVLADFYSRNNHRIFFSRHGANPGHFRIDFY